MHFLGCGDQITGLVPCCTISQKGFHGFIQTSFFLHSFPPQTPFFFTQSTTLHEKLNHCAPTHSRGKPPYSSKLHFALMQRDSSVLYSLALCLTNGRQALHSQLLHAQALWSKKMSLPFDVNSLYSNTTGNEMDSG